MNHCVSIKLNYTHSIGKKKNCLKLATQGIYFISEISVQRKEHIDLDLVSDVIFEMVSSY